jgi:zinc transporter
MSVTGIQPDNTSSCDFSADPEAWKPTDEPQPGVLLGLVPGLVWGFRFSADGKATSLDVEKPIESGPADWLWLHLNLSDARARHWVASSRLPDPARAALLSSDAFQQMLPCGDCVYGAFADFIRDIGKPNHGQLGFLHFTMMEGLLVSGRHHPLTAPETTREALENGHTLLSVAGLLEMIVERVAFGIEDAADALSTDLDQFEEVLMTGVPDDHRSRLGKVRRMSVRIHRQVAGMRASFQRFERDESKLRPVLRLAAARLAQRLDAIDHDIVAIRDRAHLLQEEAADKLSEETNRQLRILTGVTTLFLPATFVTGVFGMNTKDLPLTDVDGGFLWAMLLIAASSWAIYILMQRMGIMR